MFFEKAGSAAKAEIVVLRVGVPKAGGETVVARPRAEGKETKGRSARPSKGIVGTAASPVTHPPRVGNQSEQTSKP